MPLYDNDASRYRFRAEELRTMATKFTPENRAMLLNMADYYDRFAEQLQLQPLDSRYIKA